MFEAPWNICYTPKILDPFTGHEAKGVLPSEYQKCFLAKARQLYKPFIEEYNQLLITLNVEKQLRDYVVSLSGTIAEKELVQFSKDAISELSPIM